MARRRLPWAGALAMGLGLALALQWHWSSQIPQGPKGAIEERGLTPPPPAQAQWHSPLLSHCPALDQRLGQRLVKLPLQVSRFQADPSNYSLRLRRDVYGQTLDPTPAVIVLHETVYNLGSALNTFSTPHRSDDDQVSYHTLVGRQGEIIQVVDANKRAFGAGYSAFGGRWVFTNRKLAGSLNNFALHVSLETPADGSDDELSHSGYSPAQYDALSRVLADWMLRYRIKPEAITTHRHVDLGGARADPRSFDWREIQKRLTAIGLVC